MNLNVKNRTLFCCDNLNILRGLNSGCVDLIYLDPPFNKNQQFTAPIGSSAEGAGFSDIFTQEDVKEEWVKSIAEDQDELHRLLTAVRDIDGRTSYNFCYLAYMAIRLIECHRVLCDTGSLYLHCDPTMSHYLKLVLDCIFGAKRVKNEITWRRASGGKGSQFAPRAYGNNADIIFFCTKTDNYQFAPYRRRSSDEIEAKYDKIDEHGNRYGKGAALFRGRTYGARPNLCYEWRGFENPHPSGWCLSKTRLEEEYQKGNVVITKDGRLERRKYLRDDKGAALDNIWTDIDPPSTTERTDYPTQKPIALLERIINASSAEGDVVLDPFCGCATTCVAAEKLNRQWIGIDISFKAHQIAKARVAPDAEIALITTPPTRTDTRQKTRRARFARV